MLELSLNPFWSRIFGLNFPEAPFSAQTVPLIEAYAFKYIILTIIISFPLATVLHYAVEVPCDKFGKYVVKMYLGKPDNARQE